jgi:hypothetical protein
MILLYGQFDMHQWGMPACGCGQYNHAQITSVSFGGWTVHGEFPPVLGLRFFAKFTGLEKRFNFGRL